MQLEIKIATVDVPMVIAREMINLWFCRRELFIVDPRSIIQIKKKNKE
ncbi:MAG: hypothetical protein LRY52_11775 [Sulfurospirillum cavolei]|nr:hypothetical protein [Sulfurospirillum cavolei]